MINGVLLNHLKKLFYVSGHLTQVLWEGSEFLGVGVSRNGYYTFVVCNYNPPGNYKGEYAENVPPVK